MFDVEASSISWLLLTLSDETASDSKEIYQDDSNTFGLRKGCNAFANFDSFTTNINIILD